LLYRQFFGEKVAFLLVDSLSNFFLQNDVQTEITPVSLKIITLTKNATFDTLSKVEWVWNKQIYETVLPPTLNSWWPNYRLRSIGWETLLLDIYDREQNYGIHEFKIYNQQQTAAPGTVRYGRTFNLLLILCSLFTKSQKKYSPHVRMYVYLMLLNHQICHIYRGIPTGFSWPWCRLSL